MIRSKRKKSTNVAEKTSRETPSSSVTGPTESKPYAISNGDGDFTQAELCSEGPQSPMSNGGNYGRHVDFNELQDTGPGVPPPPYPGKSGVSLSPSSVASAIRRRLNLGWSKEAKQSQQANRLTQPSSPGHLLTPLPEDLYNENQDEQVGVCNSRLGRHISRSRDRIKHSRSFMRARSTSSLTKVEDEENIGKPEERIYIQPYRNRGIDENHNRPIHRPQSLASLSEEGYLQKQIDRRAEVSYNQNGGRCDSPVAQRLSRSRERLLEHSRRFLRSRSTSSLAESDDEQNIEDGIYLNNRSSCGTDVSQNGPIHRTQSLMSLSEANFSQNDQQQGNRENLGESSPGVTRHISRSRERIQHNRKLMRSRSSSSLAASDDEHSINNLENTVESYSCPRDSHMTDVNQNTWRMSQVNEEQTKAAQRHAEEINKLRVQLTEMQDEYRSLKNVTNKMKKEDGLLQKTKEELQKVLTEKKQLQQAHARLELELTQFKENADLKNNARNNDKSLAEFGKAQLSEMFVSDGLESDKLRRIVQELKDSHIKMRSENLSLQSKCEKQAKEMTAIVKSYEEREQTWKKQLENLRLQVSGQGALKENHNKKTEQIETEIQQKKVEANVGSSNLAQHQQIGDKDENRSLKEDVVSITQCLQHDNGNDAMVTKEIGTTDLKTVKENLWGAITDLDKEKKRAELEVIRQKMLRQEAERRVDELKKEICRFEVILESKQSTDVTENGPQMPTPTTVSMQTEDFGQELQMTKQNLARAIADNEGLCQKLEDTKKEISQLKLNLHQLEKQLHTSDLDTGKGSKFFQELRESHLTIRSENLRLQRECQKLVSTVQSHESSLRDLREERDKLQKLTENDLLLKDKPDRLHDIEQTRAEEKSTQNLESKTHVTPMNTAIQDAETDTLKRMVNDLKNRHIEMRSENLHLQSKCENLTKELALIKSSDERKQELRKPNQEVEGFVKKHSEHKKMLSNLCAEVISQENAHHKTKAEQLSTQLNEMENSFAKIKRDKINLEQQLEERETEIRKHQQQDSESDRLKRVIEELKETSMKSRSEIESRNLKLQQEIKEKDSDFTKITEELTKKTEETEKLSEQNRDLESALKQTRFELQLSESQVQEVKHKLASEMDNRERTVTKVEQELKGNAQKAEEKCRKMSTLLDTIYQEKLTWELEVRRLKEVETTLTKLETTNSMLEHTVQVRESTITEVKQEMEDNATKAEEKYEKISATLDNIRQENAALETEVQELKKKERQLKDMETKNYMLEKRIKERESTIAKVRQDLEENAKKAEEKYKKMSVISDNIYQEKLTLEIEVKKLRKVETTLATFKTKNSRLEQEIKEREMTISKVKEELEESVRKAGEGNARYKSVEDKLNLNLALVEEMKAERERDKVRQEQALVVAETSMKSMREELEGKLRAVETELTQAKCAKTGLVQKLKVVEDSNRDAENDKCKLKRELEELQQKVSGTASILSEQVILVKELKNEKNDIAQKVKELEKSKQDAENDKCKLKLEIEELQGRLSKSTSRLAEQETSVKQLKGEKSDIAQKLKESEKSRQDAENDKCKLKLEIEELQGRISKSTSRLAEQETLVKELKDEKKNLVQKLNELEKVKQDEENDKCKLKLELEEMQGKISGFTSRLAEQDVLIKELKRERDETVRNLKEAEMSKQDEESNKCRLKLELEEMQGKISGFTSRLAEQDVLIKELKRERDETVRKLKEAEKSKQNAEDDRSRIKRKFEQLEESVGNSTSELEKLKMLAKELKDTNISIRTENLRLERQCTKYSEIGATVKACEDRERNLIKRNAELKTEVEELHCIREKYNELCDTVQEKVVIENKYEEAKTQLIEMETKEMELKAQNLKLQKKITEIETQTPALEEKINDKEIEIRRLTEELKEMSVKCEELEEQLRRRSWEVDYAKTVSDVKKEQQQIMEKRLAEGESASKKCITELENKVENLQINLTEKMGEVSDLTEKLAYAENEKALAESERNQVEESLQETQLKLAQAEEELADVSKEKRNLFRQVKHLENTKYQAERKVKEFKLQVARMEQDSYESEREKEELRDIVSEKVWQLTLMLDEKEKIEDTVFKAKQELSALIKMGIETTQVDAADQRSSREK